MNEYELQSIWKKNLREFNDVLRLDALIIRAMQEAIKESQSKQFSIADAVTRRGKLIAFLLQQHRSQYVTIYQDVIEFADKLLKEINLTGKDLPEYNEILYHSRTLSDDQFREYWNEIQGNIKN